MLLLRVVAMPSRAPRPARVDRRPRLTWPCWLHDWLKALRSRGWQCCNKIVLPRHTQLGKAQMHKLDVLYLHRKGVVVCLHPHSSKLPTSCSLADNIDVGSKAEIEQVFHIVRGNRRTQRFGVKTPIPDVVEMNGQLYDRYSVPDCWECRDSEINDICKEYQDASPHHQSLRNFKCYWTYSKRIADSRARASSGLLTVLL